MPWGSAWERASFSEDARFQKKWKPKTVPIRTNETVNGQFSVFAFSYVFAGWERKPVYEYGISCWADGKGEDSPTDLSPSLCVRRCNASFFCSVRPFALCEQMRFLLFIADYWLQCGIVLIIAVGNDCIYLFSPMLAIGEIILVRCQPGSYFEQDYFQVDVSQR